MSPIGLAFVSTSLLVSDPASPCLSTEILMPDCFWKASSTSCGARKESCVTRVTVGVCCVSPDPSDSEHAAATSLTAAMAVAARTALRFIYPSCTSPDEEGKPSLRRHDPVTCERSRVTRLSARLAGLPWQPCSVVQDVRPWRHDGNLERRAGRRTLGRRLDAF